VPRTAQDMTGLRFGRLLVTRRDLGAPLNQVMWVCICDCGAQTSVRVGDLRRGTTKSCGCWMSERMARRWFRPHKPRRTGGIDPAFDELT
jgi:hypothetical protein